MVSITIQDMFAKALGSLTVPVSIILGRASLSHLVLLCFFVPDPRLLKHVL